MLCDLQVVPHALAILFPTHKVAKATAAIAQTVLASKPLRYPGSPLAALPESLANQLASLPADGAGRKSGKSSKDSDKKQAVEADATAAAMLAVAVAMAAGVAKHPAMAQTLLSYAMDSSKTSAAGGMAAFFSIGRYSCSMGMARGCIGCWPCFCSYLLGYGEKRLTVSPNANIQARTAGISSTWPTLP